MPTRRLRRALVAATALSLLALPATASTAAPRMAARPAPAAPQPLSDDDLADLDDLFGDDDAPTRGDKPSSGTASTASDEKPGAAGAREEDGDLDALDDLLGGGGSPTPPRRTPPEWDEDGEDFLGDPDPAPPASPDAPRAPDGPGEAIASHADSAGFRWTGTNERSPYTMRIRLTDRVQLTGGKGMASSLPATGCDVTGDSAPDIVAGDPVSGRVDIIDHIPVGSGSDELTRAIDAQPGRIALPAPSGAAGFGAAVACTSRALVVAGTDSTLYRYALPVTAASTPVAVRLDDGPVASIASLSTPGRPSDLIAVSTASRIRVIDTAAPAPTDPAAAGSGVDIVHGLTKAPILHAIGDITGDGAPDLAAALPDAGRVLVITDLTSAGSVAGRAFSATAPAGGSFGAAVAALGDITGDGLADFAIGAPTAGHGEGAVAVVNGRRSGDVTVDLTAARSALTPVSDASGARAGTLHRIHERLGLGAGLALLRDDSGAGRDALAIGLPDNKDDSGALIVPTAELARDHIALEGLQSLEGRMIAALANGAAGDGAALAVLPHRPGDRLIPLLVGNRDTGRLGVWTVDPAAGDGPSAGPDAKNLPPKPVLPPVRPALTPTDRDDLRTWLGEFGQGLGSTLARGSCDVTGDGIADIVSGNLTRSQWRFDPFYAETTETRGWVHNVTGQIQVIPGGTRGAALPVDGVVSINGPAESGTTDYDASIGLSVACLRDANGDGIGDIAFGSHTMGLAWVVYGGPDLAATDLDALTADRGYTIRLPRKGNPAAHLADAGDLNGDGLSDVAVVIQNTALNNAAIADDQALGVAYVVAGNADGHEVDLSREAVADSSDVLARVITPAGFLATSLDPVGDVDGDGRTDFVLADYTHAERTNVVSGTAWLLTGVANGARIDLGADGSWTGSRLTVPSDASYRLGVGASVAAAGDVDGDGFGDVVIGFDGGHVLNHARGGIAVLHGGADLPETIALNPAGTPDPRVCVLTAPGEGAWAGHTVDVLTRAGASPLIAFGSPGAHEGDGRAYLVDASAVEGARTADGAAAADGRGCSTTIEALGDAVRVIDSAAEKGARARFGKGLAFVGNHLGMPTLAVSGDGVIDDEPKDVLGVSHAAHVMAIGLRLPAAEAPAPGPDGSGSGTADAVPTPRPDEGGRPASTGAAPAGERTAGAGLPALARTGGPIALTLLVAAGLAGLGVAAGRRRTDRP
ncbi:integrin alpha [Actinomyces sp. B33]|uniref:integrin alpha n=1 Tax=Actinomyces sp. B33 TaxID=2942131 RepID=UPI00233FB0B6|nr:integrin alpha [Actinomyces sp. B33]MDC4232345.1 integrin alpha [Actinomyces sp. B33]